MAGDGDALTGLQRLAAGQTVSAFTRLRRLLADVVPEHPNPIDMTVGEPHETMPDFVADIMKSAEATLTKYTPIRCSPALREAIAAWINRRYLLSPGIDPVREVHPLNGSREGLFFALLPAVGRKRLEVGVQPAVLLPNPNYHTYNGAALACQAEPHYLDAGPETGFLPDLSALSERRDLLARTAALYLCSPSNPQGAMASRRYLETAISLARAHDFMLFVDECYSEIYTREPPVGALEVASATQGRFANVVAFNSLSKRSNLPGLRSGFAAGDGDFLETMAEIRNLIAPQMPGPVEQASIAVWGDEAHVEVIRAAYRVKFDIADEIIGGRFGYRRPDGGFFLWLDVGQFGASPDVTVTLWKRYGVKVVPGAYLAQPGPDGRTPGDRFVRVALVHDPATTRDALSRLVQLAS